MSEPRGRMTAKSSAALADPSNYVEFYMGNAYTWKESGVARMITWLRSRNVDGAHYSFDSEFGWFVVRCLRSDAEYIQAKFVSLQNVIAQEYISMKNGRLIDYPEFTANHPDVELMADFTQSIDMNPGEAVGNVASSVGYNDSHGISLEVPESLREFPLVVAWQDLQSKSKTFDPDFISLAAIQKIEQAHNVAIKPDEGQKVFFIGGYDAETLHLVKVKLSVLLQDCEDSDQTLPYLRHIFFVSCPDKWEVEIKKIMDVNPGIRKSTILDPWDFCIIQDHYKCLAQASCLRVCTEKPSRPPNTLWSFNGPFPRSILETQEPRYETEIFKGLEVHERQCLDLQITDNKGGVEAWVHQVSELKLQQAPPDSDAVIALEAFNPISGLDPDAPVPMDSENFQWGPTCRVDDDSPVALETKYFARSNPRMAAPNRKHPQAGCNTPNILDRDDPELRNPRSNLQRPMLPLKRTIYVPDPSLLTQHDLQSSAQQESDINQGNELNRLVKSVQNLLVPMPVRYGLVELRIEIGRFFASKVPASGLSNNLPNKPTRGWEADKLREKLNHQKSFFTRALSYFGNDVDLLVNLKVKNTKTPMWKPHSRNIFLDFRFTLGVDDTPLELILEVDTNDYSWRIRTLKNEYGLTTVHCLQQHWDFRVRTSWDRSLEIEEHCRPFAKALIDSLEVSPTKLAYQNLFDANLANLNAKMQETIIVKDARIRQVCRREHRDGKTYLDITRIMPTKPTNSGTSRENSIEVETLTRSKLKTGDFTSWYEATISSARLEGALRENATLIPGDKAGWKAQDLAGDIRGLCIQAFNVVEQMDPVGISCDNGYDERYWNLLSNTQSWNYKF